MAAAVAFAAALALPFGTGGCAAFAAGRGSGSWGPAPGALGCAFLWDMALVSKELEQSRQRGQRLLDVPTQASDKQHAATSDVVWKRGGFVLGACLSLSPPGLTRDGEKTHKLQVRTFQRKNPNIKQLWAVAQTSPTTLRRGHCDRGSVRQQTDCQGAALSIIC